MKFETSIAILTFLGVAMALPAHLRTREVPQEHSHEQFLTTVRASLQTNNPAGISDPVFGLLGDAAAAGGKGSISDVECLQQATADQAFTNAKKANDVAGMTAALVYRALERNTQKVGQASNPCTSIKAVNPGIAAISQHQDPASANAAANNKAVTLALAKQIASIGGDPQTALKAGTFAPGSTSDTSGKGNTCDTQNDSVGCIFSQNLLVEDATAAEVSAAAGGAAAPAAPAPSVSGGDASNNGSSSTNAVPATSTTAQAAVNSPNTPSTSSAAAAGATGAAGASGTSSATPAVGSNVQTFTGSLGGGAPAVVFTGGARPFSTDNNTFTKAEAANQRSCSVQNNVCCDAVNHGQLQSTIATCNQQEAACNAVAAST